MKFYTNVVQFSNTILVRGRENGRPFQDRVQYSPTLFIPTNTRSNYRTLRGQSVAPVKQGSIRDAKEFISSYNSVEGFEVFGNTNYVYTYITENYPNEVKYNFDDIRIFNFDIETTSEYGFPFPETAAEEVVAITACVDGKYVVWGCGNYVPSREDVRYIRCFTEGDLLARFIDFWKSNHPDIVTGWNVKLFDIPYIVNRTRKVLGEEYVKVLSPWNSVRESSVRGIGGKEILAYEISGISVLDYIDLYKKFSMSTQESYRLDHIAHVELGERKLDYSEYGSLLQLYKKDFQTFCDYNVKDVELVENLEKRMRLIEMAATLAYDAKVNFSDVFTQVRMWDTIIYNELIKQNIVLPPKTGSSMKEEAFEGAYVKEPQVGFHDWIVSFDLASLYPHLIMQYNLSPEMLVPSDKSGTAGKISGVSVAKMVSREVDTNPLKNMSLAITPNGQFFRTEEQGFLPKIMERLFLERSRYKKEMLAREQELEYENNEEKKKFLKNEISRLKNMQMARKVQLNSAFGAIGNPHFRFFDIRVAEAITLSGQLSIRWIEKALNQYLNGILKSGEEDYVIAMDTDSCYINLSKFVDQVFAGKNPSKETVVNFLDKVCSGKFQDVIDKSYAELAEYTNAYAQKMSMKREVIADKGVWTGKKRYILNVYDNEGVRYSTPKLKVMGLEMVKSSTPAICRKEMEKVLSVVLNGTEEKAQELISEFKTKFFTLPAEEVFFPRGCQGLEKYRDPHQIFQKGTPIQVRGALIFNHLINKKKLGGKYETIKDGDKVKFGYLRTPNPIGDNTISILTVLPQEFELEKFIDYETQFKKAFVDPVDGVFTKIGWSVEKKSSLDNFFG